MADGRIPVDPDEPVDLDPGQYHCAPCEGTGRVWSRTRSPNPEPLDCERCHGSGIYEPLRPRPKRYTCVDVDDAGVAEEITRCADCDGECDVDPNPESTYVDLTCPCWPEDVRQRGATDLADMYEDDIPW